MKPRVTTMAVLASLLALTAFTGCSAVPGPKVTEEFRETYTIGADEPIDVETFNGNITVTTWDQDTVEVYGVKTSNYGSDELAKVKIVVDTTGGLSVQAAPETNNVRVSVSFTLQIPQNALLRSFDTSNGNVQIDGGRGDVNAHTSNGSITINNVDGYITAQTSNGRINVAGTTGVISAKTSNGSISVDIRKLQGTSTLQTSNGSVRINVALDLNANLDLHTSNGTINLHGLSLSNTRSSQSSLTGQLGSGGPMIAVTTSNGSIDVYGLQ